jgi:AraC-like DNA-binding protein
LPPDGAKGCGIIGILLVVRGFLLLVFRIVTLLVKRREKHEGFVGQRLVVLPRPILVTALQHPLLKQLLPTDAGYYPKAKGHVCMRELGCPESIFIYCAEGDGWCEIAGQRHEVAKNQLLVIPASKPHVYGAGKKTPWTIHWFHAVGSNVPIYLERLGVTAEKPVVPLGGDVQLFSLFEDVLEGLEHGFTMTHLIYAAHSLTHLMGLILRHKDEFGYGETTVRERVVKSIEFMKGHLREPLKIATLAALVNLSRSHYTTLFRRVTGYAPLSYLNLLRMQRAVQLLNTTELSIKRISDQLGFSDQFYFSRAFRKMHNHSPSEHRRRYGG